MIKKLFVIFLFIFINNISYSNEDISNFNFLKCLEISNSDNQDTKYFEVNVPEQIMIERNGYSFTYTRITPFLIQAELQGLAKLSLHRHLGTLAYSNLNADGTVKDNQVYQCDSVPRLL